MVKKANNKPGFNGSDKDQRTVQLSALFAALPDNYFLIDQQGTILSYRVRPGVSLIDDPVAYIGSNVADILPPAPSALFKEHMRQQHDAQDVVTWEYHIDLEGKRWDREAHLCPLSGSDEMVLVVRDITKQRQAERERAEAEERLERIISNLPGAVISRRFDGSEFPYHDTNFPKVVYASPQTAEIWGVSAKDMCDIRGLTEPMVNTDDIKDFSKKVRKALENFEAYSFRFRITTYAGEQKWLETNTKAYKHKDGYTYTDGFVLDVTKEVQAQEQLEAQRKIADRAQKLDSIGQLTGGMAHDFNNLLAAIMFSLEMLRDEETDEGHLSLIDNCLTAAQRGADLTRSMLAFASKASLDPSVIDLNKLVEETRNWAGRTLPSNIEIETSLSEELSPTMVDVSSTESALLNLLVNARDAMPDGGKLTIETQNVRLDEASLDAHPKKVAPGQYIMLAVSDTGHGIPAEIVSRIFEPFFTTKPPDKGAGLGLSMVFGFMQQSGGTVQVTSEAGVGAVFKLYFKAYLEEDEGLVEDTIQIKNLLGDGRKILVVEDDKMVLSILVKTLEKAGYRVTSAKTGDEALALFKADPRFDLLLTDIMMPGTLKGRALSRAVRETVPDLPVVFMSGYENEATDQNNEPYSDDIRLTKPVSRVDMLTAIMTSLTAQLKD